MPVGIFPRPNLVSLECECPLNRDLPKEKFHCMVKTVKKTIFQQICPIFQFARQTLVSLGAEKGKVIKKSLTLMTNL